MNAQQFATDLLYREADFLDSRDWDAWLALYVRNCEFWMPAWKSEHMLTDNPKTEVSLIYYGNRAGLEERVQRVRSGRSAASAILPRTQHGLTNILTQDHDESSCTVLSNWTVHQFSPKRREVDVLFGRYRHELTRDNGEWRIRRKKIVLMNDTMHAMVDFYSL